jgi:peroxiredoxin
VNRRLAILGIILTGMLTLIGCILVIGGLWFAFSTLSPASVSVSSPAGANGPVVATPPGGAPRVGAIAPDFSLSRLDQQPLRLGQFRGKAVLLNFWATWCGPCSAEMPNIEQVYQGLSHDDVAILAVNQEEFADQVRGYADLYHLHFPILLDGHAVVGNLYRVQALPTTVFVDRSGVIREIHVGGPMSQDFIKAHIEALLRPSP